MPPVYAHIVGPNEYTLMVLMLRLELTAQYIIINMFRIPSVDQKKALQASIDAPGTMPLIVIGPIWNFHIDPPVKFMDSVNQARFIVERVDEDSARIALVRNQIRIDIIEGVINLDLSRRHLELVWSTIATRYTQLYKQTRIVDMLSLLAGSCIKPVSLDKNGVVTSKAPLPSTIRMPGIDKSVHFNRHLDITQIPARKK